MKRFVALIVVLAAACVGIPGPARLAVGQRLPVELQVQSAHSALLFVTTLEACFSCSLQGGFVALRSAQRLATGQRRPSLTALLVGGSLEDTTALRRTLLDERLDAQIEVMARRRASAVLDLARIPAIYLIDGDTVLRAWESSGDAVVALERHEIAEALADLHEPRPR